MSEFVTSFSRLAFAIACWLLLVDMRAASASDQLEVEFREMGVELAFKTHANGERVGYVFFERQEVSRELLARVCRIPHLGYLTFSHGNVESTSLIELSNAVDLRYLAINSNGLEFYRSSHIPRLPKLEELLIDEYVLFDDADKLREKWPRLRSLSLWCDGDESARLETIVRQFPALSEIMLDHAVLTNAETARLAELSQLRSVRFRDCRVSPGAISQLARLQNLRSLTLNHSDVSEADLKTLQGLKKLKQFDLSSSTRLNATVVTQWPILEVLRIYGSGVTDDSLRSLARMPRLKDLQINGAQLTPEGVLALNDSSVETLSFSFGVPLTDGGTVALCTPPHVRELRVDFAQNVKGPVRLSSLSFEKMPHLRILNVESVNLEAGHLRSLRQCELSELKCSFQSLDDEVCSLLLALPYLESLQIHVPSRHADGECAKRLRSALPFVKINQL